MSDDRFEQGMAVRRAVLGDAHVDRAEARKTAFDADFQRYIVENAWGSVWARPGLERRTRSLLTLVILASLGRQEELVLHLRGARNLGISEEELKEALLHVAAYAGIPAANSAFATAKRIFREETDGASGAAADATQR